MTLDRALLARYFRQLADLGVDQVFLDDMTAADALALLAGHATSAARAHHVTSVTTVTAANPANAARAANAPTAANPAASPAAPAAQRTQQERARAAAALQVLGVQAGGCALCRLHEGRTSVVFGEGNPVADVVVVGEAPGQEEDRTGRPFVGRAGRLLDQLLMSAGFPRENVYICNVLKCRPPNNRNPLPDEVDPCTTNFLHAQLEAIAPKVLIGVGKFAAQVLASSQESIGRLRGRVHTYRGTPLIVTYHPAYLLRSPQMTRVAWQDFQLLRRVLDEQS